MKKKIALLGAAALLVSSFDQGMLLAAEQGTDTQIVDVQEDSFADASGELVSDGEEQATDQAGQTADDPSEFLGESDFEDVDSDLFSSGEEDEELKEAPSVSGTVEHSGFNDNQVLCAGESGYVDGINQILVNGTAWRKSDSKLGIFSSAAYYLAPSENKIYFDRSGSGMLKSGDLITLSNPQYKDLVLQVKGQGDDFRVIVYDPQAGNDKEGPSDGENTLFVRLVGAFEGALTGQQKYDAVSGASTSVSTNKNSNVEVQAAVLPDGTEPTEDDWKPLSTVISVNSKRTKVNIDTESCGMSGVYSIWDSSLSLSGVPDKVGTYPVSVTVTDENGRTAVSNELYFKIFARNEKLEDYLKLENAVKTADGKYMYDMEPWAIPNFGGENETVTVPAQIKAWYGSHTSGTYGELGYSVEKDPVQTLIVPDGCTLTMVNMKILSSVKIWVEKGGLLTLRDSSLHGQVEVMDGGRLSVNYDDYSGNFITGTSINGQIILNTGAILENSMIYSNTNFLANGSWIRQNISPVIQVNGDVVIRGEVYVRGDDAPTGTDPATEKSYSGQPAMRVSSGSLNIEKDSTLAVFGGGKIATTSVGGNALILENSQVKGEGKLIAVGGTGHGDQGDHAVTGSGSINTNEAYLEGGACQMPGNSSITAGAAYTEGISVGESVRLKAVEGKRITNNYDSVGETYWRDTTQKPDLKLYEFTDADTPKPTSAPQPTDVPQPTQVPQPSDTPKPTEAPQPTAGPQPTLTPDQGQENGKNQDPGTTPGESFKPVIRVNVKSIPLKVGQSTNKVKVTYAKGDSVKTWKSSNTKVVTVSKTGVLKAGKKTGKATVTVTLKSGLSAKIQVKVQKSAARTESIRVAKKNLLIKKGSRQKITPVISPVTSRETVKYTSSSTAVARVSKTGVITARKTGKARITIRSGKKKTVVYVTVKK